MKNLGKILFVSMMLMSTMTTARTLYCEVETSLPLEITLPNNIILDTLSGSKLNFDHWVIQLKPDPFLDGIRIKATQKNISFDWAIKTLDGEELGSKTENRKEARLDCRFLPTGTYVLELRTSTETSSVKLVKY
ncbi:MAG: T9SS type A sorting domain-containing protein [Saprospiraceae bacterium]